MSREDNKLRAIVVVAFMVTFALFLGILEITVKFYDVAEIPVKLWILTSLLLLGYAVRTALLILWAWIRTLPPVPKLTLFASSSRDDEEEAPSLLVAILCFLFFALTFFFVYIWPYLPTS